MASLESPKPILDRAELNSIFSNFIDIWNLHRSFFSSLSSNFDAGTQHSVDTPPNLAPTLQAHFPYLSLYNPFITAFPTSLSSISELRTRNPLFNSFMQEREVSDICNRLGLQAWLLTIVQRCPRYLLLIKVREYMRTSATPERSF